MIWKWLTGSSKTTAKTEGEPFSRPEAGWVSVWLADITRELELDGYSDREFARDHGVVPFSEGEHTVHPVPLALEDLLKGFWLHEMWSARVIDACREQGLREAPCAVVRVHYRHQPTRPGTGPLRFVGCVQLTPDGRVGPDSNR
jgi:hypothetical protein